MSFLKYTKTRSIRKQISAIFIGSLLIAFLVILAVNGLFLERYYLTRKMSALEKTFHTLEGYENAVEESDFSAEWLSQISSENLTWVIASDRQGQAWKMHSGYGASKTLANMTNRLFGYSHGLELADKDDKRFEVLKKTSSYIVMKTREKNERTEYVEIWGMLPEGSYCLVRSPLESIRESVKISNRFYAMVGIIITLISGTIIWFISRRIARPIVELTDLSRRMAELDFDAHYQSTTNNEIDVLGHNFNSMSEELKKTITELKQANVDLMNENERKTKVDEQRREFLGNVSHELKTPIALIQGYAEGLKDNISEDVESREFYCDVIIDEASKMNTLVRGLLNLTQLESGQNSVNLCRFNLVDLIYGVLNKSRILIEQNEADVCFEEKEPVYVWADEFKIEEVLTNYLTNALNHLGGEKKINIYVEKETPLKVYVHNTGNPISEENLDMIWNKFFKEDKAHTREYGGSGIGLSIVKAIMDSHGQSCGVYNEEDGVTFWFTLDNSI